MALKSGKQRVDFNSSLNCIQTIERKAIGRALAGKTALKSSLCVSGSWYMITD